MKRGQPQQLRDMQGGDKALIEPARLGQGEVMALKQQITDSRGMIGVPLIALSTLATMERKGTINRQQRMVGDAFHAVFRMAGLDELRAADMARIAAPGAGCRVEHGGGEHARRRIAGAMTLLGGQRSVAASCAWHVLGLEWSLREWAAQATACNVDRATGVLIAVLGSLDPHFGA